MAVNSCLVLSITAAEAHLHSFPRYAHTLMSLQAGALSLGLGFLSSKGRGLAVLYTRLCDLLQGEEISFNNKS